MKANDELGECINCVYFDIEEYTCKNKRGMYYNEHDYHAADTGCKHWKPCAEIREDLEPKTLKERDFVQNPWTEWKNKRLIHE